MEIAFREPRDEDRDWIWNATTETAWQDMPPTERLSLKRKEWEAHFRGEAEALLQARITETWVAEDASGARLGYIIVGRTVGMFSPLEFGFIYDIYVNPIHRRQGIGRALLEKAEEYCDREGLRFLRLEAASDNWPAITMYNQSGWRPERLVLVKDLKLR